MSQDAFQGRDREICEADWRGVGLHWDELLVVRQNQYLIEEIPIPSTGTMGPIPWRHYIRYITEANP